MSTLFRFSLLFVLMTGSAHAAIQSDSTSSDSQSPRQKLISSYGKLPLSFEANQGQTDSRVGFLSRGEGYHLYLTSTEAVLALTKRPGVDSEGGDTALRMKLAEANPHPKISGEEELPGKSHYFVGRDPSKWRTDIPTYAKVRYREVYPGIDLIYYGNQRQLEYDFVVAPGADPKRIELQFEGADRLLINEQGDLLLKIKGEEIQFLKPRLYQEVNGIRREVLGRYVLRGKNRIGFQVADYDPSRLLIIDPVLSYSTFFGGTSSAIGFRDSPSGIAVDGSGAIYLAGSAGTTDFPVTPGAPQSSNHGKQNVFISKLNPAGTALIYSTYLGGSAYDINTGIAIDSSGNAYVIGYTYSTDFPTTPGALQTVAPSPTQPNNFAAKLNASGTALIYSTYLPDCGAGAIAVDNSGDAYIAGSVFSSPSCPTTAGVYQPFFGGGNSDAFVMKLNPAGSIILYATYLGGSNDDEAAGIVVDATGNAYVTGRTLSINFPLVHPLQSAIGGGWDAFVAKINPTGSDLEYATYWGGSGNDYGYAIAIDPSGNAYFTGYTYSSDFPVTPGAFQTTAGKSIGTLSDAFISQIGPHGATLGYSSYLGGSDYDSGSAIAVDSAGNAYVAGLTGSSDFPLARAMKNSLAGSRCGENIPCWNAFVARVNAGGDALTFSTFLGGSGGASSNGIALDSHRNIYLVGSSFRGDFPITSGAFQKDPRTMFITKIAESSVVTTITATPQSGIGPFTVHFEGAATSESGAAITSYFWDFGDGTTGTGPKVDHTYTASRGYTAQLTATDSNSQQGSAHVNINVSDFTLSLSPDSADIVPGESATATLVIQPVPYEGIPVNLSCSVPSVTGLACSMNPTSVVANFPIDQRDPGTTSMLAVTTQASTPIGSYPVTITGRSGGAVHQVTFLLRVRPGDTFNKPDGPTLGSNWNVILPVLEIFSGQVRNQDSGDKAAIFNWPIGPDQDVSVNCKVTAENNGCGVMARWSSPDNYYYARIDVGHLNLVLFKSVNGVVTQLGKTDLPLRFTRYDTYYPIRLVTRGNSLFASVVIMQWADGCSHNNCVGPVTYAITAADNSLSSGDYSGIRSFASAPDTTWFKTFSVIRPDTPMQGELLFTDEFNRTTGLGSNWQVFFGSYTTNGSNAVSQGSIANWAAVAQPLNTNDYTVESVLTIPAGSLYSGIVARGNLSTGFYKDLYAAQIATDGSVNLYRRNAGNWTQLKSTQAGIVAGTPYTLKLKVSGSNPVNLEVSLNGNSLFAYQDNSSSQILSGVPGIQNYNPGVKYDRFTVFLNATPDTTPPSTPLNLSAFASPKQVFLSWPASEDNVYVSGYHVFRNGALIATVFGPAYVDSAVSIQETYTYAVSAFDSSKNESPQSTPTTVTVPTVRLSRIDITPISASIAVGGSQQFTATGVYNDASTKDITTSVTWNSDTPAVASISNQAGSQGLATGLSAGSTFVSAKDPATNIPSASVFLRVTPNNQPPIARLSVNPSSGTAPLAVHFDGSASSDPDGTIASYSWSFGDGGSGSGATADHTYTTSGTYTATLTVTDNLGATGSAQTTLTVSPQSSSILFNDDFNRTTGLGSNWQVFFGSFTTDGSNAVSQGSIANWAALTQPLNTNDYIVESVLTIPASSLYSGIVARGNLSTGFYRDLYAAQIATDGSVNLYRRNNYAWTLLQSAQAGIVAGTPYTLKLKVAGSNPVNLEVSLNGTSLFTYQDSSASQILSGVPGIQNYNPGVEYDRFTVYTSSGSPVNQPPVAKITTDATSGVAPLTVHFDGSTSFDPDGSVISYSWSFGDGNTGSNSIISHIYTAAGTYTTTLTVTDNNGVTGSAQVTITVTASGTVTLFSDDFNRTTGLGPNWQVYFGSFTTDGNNAVSQGTIANWAAITPNLNTNDYSVEATLIVPASSLYSGIAVRGNPANSFYMDLYAAQIATDGHVNLYRRNAGNWTLLKSAPASIVAGTAYTLKLAVSGVNPVSLEVSLNGSVLFDYSDSSASRILSGIPGIGNYNSGVIYDRFSVTSP